MRHTGLSRTAAVVAIAGLLAGCSGGDAATADAAPATDQPSPGGSIVIGLSSEPDALNVYLARTSASLLLAHRALPRLAEERMPDGRHEAGLFPSFASGWDVSDDGRTISFALREGGVWTDGTPLDCDDVVYTWKTQISPELGWRAASIKRHIEAVDCPDPLTARFVFSKSYPGMLMDANDLHIVSDSLASIPYDTWRETDWAEAMTWAGPFLVSSHVPGQEITLDRHDGWFGEPGKPWLDRVVLRVIPDQSARLTQLLSGDLDMVLNLSPEDAGRAMRANGVSVVRRPSPAYVYLGWNTIDPDAFEALAAARSARCTAEGRDPCPDDPAAVAALATSDPHPLFGDARVRRALTQAIDRETLVDTLLLGEGSVPASPILDPLPEHDPSLEPWPYDPAAARRALAEAGFSDSDGDGVLDRDGRPFSFELLVQAGNLQRKEAATLVQRDLDAVGVKVDIVPVENSAFYGALARRGMDAWIGSWVTSLRVDMTEMLHADAAGSSGLNFGTFTDGDADALALRARDLADEAARRDAWRAWERRFHTLQPYTMLFHPNRLTGVRDRVRGTESILPNDDLAGLEGWWLSGR